MAPTRDDKIGGLVVKPSNLERGSLKIIKGRRSSTGSAEENLATIKALHSDGSNLVTKYIFNSDKLSDGHIVLGFDHIDDYDVGNISEDIVKTCACDSSKKSFPSKITLRGLAGLETKPLPENDKFLNSLPTW